jgi:hypothetical protein
MGNWIAIQADTSWPSLMMENEPVLTGMEEALWERQ